MLIRKRHPEAVSLDEPGPGDLGSDEEIEPLQITDWCCLPEQELVSAESRRRLDAAVDRLPKPLQVVFILRDMEGLSIKETSETLRISEQLVKTRLFRARLKLREDLSQYFSERMSEKSSND